MDFDDIGNKIANLTLYDVKSLYRQAKNYALNISEIEAKVDEATNDDPWGASSTLMQEIAQATHNFQEFNEIMPTIYRRFMEKEASEWRQIYKALQLLEYLVKNGSERVVDDARSHLATIKILRNFHYIDDKGKDQGLNVRNRAKELSEMLSDVDRIRQERRKARQNRNKYTGSGTGEFVPGSGTGRYGGFGSDSFYAGNAGIGPGSYASGSGAGAGAGGDGSANRESFEEYDAGDFEDRPSSGNTRISSTTRAGRAQAGAAKKEEPAPKVADLFSFDDDEPAAPAASSSLPAATATASSGAAVDAFGDDFDDFQGAPAASAATAPKPAGQASLAAAKPAAPAPSANFDFFGASQPASSGSTVTSPGFAGGSGVLSPVQPTRTNSTASATSGALSPQQQQPAKAAAASSSSFNFDDLWASSSGKATGAGKQKMSMAELAKQQSANAMWSSNTSTPASQPQQQGGAKKDIFDLL